MAIPISSTPTLKGKEARIFVDKANENEKKIASSTEVKEAVKIFCEVMKNQKESSL